MASSTNQKRNIALLGTGGTGKTTLQMKLTGNADTRGNMHLDNGRTMEVKISSATTSHCTLNVADVPGLKPTSTGWEQEKVSEARAALQALGSIHRIVYVMKFTDRRFSSIEQRCLRVAAAIFGWDRFWSHAVFVVTRSFQSFSEEQVSTREQTLRESLRTVAQKEFGIDVEPTIHMVDLRAEEYLTHMTDPRFLRLNEDLLAPIAPLDISNLPPVDVTCYIKRPETRVVVRESRQVHVGCHQKTFISFGGSGYVNDYETQERRETEKRFIKVDFYGVITTTPWQKDTTIPSKWVAVGHTTGPYAFSLSEGISGIASKIGNVTFSGSVKF